MLEHSRRASGESTPTDLNRLADEYLRLSYHGMRAKNKALTANYELLPDESLPIITVVPQDIGRVLLNLLNNAFYAVWQRVEQQDIGLSNQETAYQPWVRVSTIAVDKHPGQAPNGGIEIRITDNGTGISEDILPKVFQPFFTTKPTGEGTGLGLSLAYDIITKGHNGTLDVASKEGGGTTFVIFIPMS